MREVENVEHLMRRPFILSGPENQLLSLLSSAFTRAWLNLFTTTFRALGRINVPTGSPKVLPLGRRKDIAFAHVRLVRLFSGAREL